MGNQDVGLRSGRYRQIRAGVVRLIRRMMYWKWNALVRMCRAVPVPSECKATVVLTAYREERLRNMEPLVRSVLKCAFVEKVILSNDNPLTRIADRVMVNDPRLVLIDQPERRGCHHRWELAREDGADFIIAIDDDVLIYPDQLARLFMHLLERREVPHGLCGCTLPHRFRERRDMEVDQLFEIYAVTREQLGVYFDTVEQILTRGFLPDGILDRVGDYIIISRSGEGRAMIHDVGFISRCATAYKKGVATFMEDDFQQRAGKVMTAVEMVRGNLPKATVKTASPTN